MLSRVAQAEEFVWKYGAIRIGRLNVPAGFKVENYNYREGVVTTLAYQDGSRITFQSSGMYSLPLFHGAEYILISSSESDAKIVRVGRSANGYSCWREDNYRPKKAIGPRISLLALFPPNVGYSGVQTPRRSVFDRALDSFIPEIDIRELFVASGVYIRIRIAALSTIFLVAYCSAAELTSNLLRLIPVDARIVSGVDIDREANSALNRFFLSDFNPDTGGRVGDNVVWIGYREGQMPPKVSVRLPR